MSNTFKVLEKDAKFVIKEVAEDGSSLGLRAESFDTEAEAKAFADGLSGETKPEQVKDEAGNEKGPEDVNVEGGSQSMAGAEVGKQAVAGGDSQVEAGGAEKSDENGGQA